MNGRDLLRVSRNLMTFADEPHWRAAAAQAYYALMLECRDTLARWGAPAVRHHNVHAFVRLKFVLARDSDLKLIGDALERCGYLRNQASYELRSLSAFASPTRSNWAISTVVNALALLDQIDADPVRRAAAIASLPP